MSKNPHDGKRTYVIGHRNPDADAICSAIAYAEFKRVARGEADVEAARCGNSNPRIDSILNRFKMPLPVFIADVTPRVRDIMIPKPKKMRITDTCAEALEQIDKHDIRALPVVDDANRVLGLISVFQLGDYFIPKPRHPREMRHVHTSIASIVHALKAETLREATEPDRVEDLYVRVGAMDISSFGSFASEEDIPPSQSIIVVGNRWDIQQRSIQLGVRLLVVTGEQKVAPEVIEEAERRDVSIVLSRFDSATTSWIIRTATNLGHVLREGKLTCFRPEEKAQSVMRRIAKLNDPLFLVNDDEGRLVGVFSKTDVLKPVNKRLILVDHNEMSQAVPGADQVEIVEILDHHRLGNPPSQHPIMFVNEPVGSTSTIVADFYRREGLDPTPDVAGIMMSGIISDTLLLQSPTATTKDGEILEWLAGIAKVEPKELAELIFTSGSVILQSKASDAVRMDCKNYHERGITFSVAQIEELGFENFWQHAQEIRRALEEYRSNEGHLFSALLVTNINSQGSLLLIAGPDELTDQVQVTYPAVEPGEIFDLPGVVSRKKQLIPFLTNVIQNVNVEAPAG